MKPQEGGDVARTEGEAVMVCSFCQRTRDQARYLLTGPGVAICEMCVATCVDSVADAERAKSGRPAMRGRLYRYVNALVKKVGSQPARVHCDVCRSRVAIADSVPVARRGRLCPACIDAVQEASVRETPGSAIDVPPNTTLERTAGAHSLAAAAQRERSAAATLRSESSHRGGRYGTAA